jgi:hypothetical protein
MKQPRSVLRFVSKKNSNPLSPIVMFFREPSRNDECLTFHTLRNFDRRRFVSERFQIVGLLACWTTILEFTKLLESIKSTL